MPKKKELSENEQEELKELINWEVYYLDCVKNLPDDEDSGLDSYFRFSVFVYIRPDIEPQNITMKEIVNLFKSIKKERTLSNEEMPELFKSFYFDEINIEKFDEPLLEDIGHYFNIFQKNYAKGYPVLTDVEMEMNSAGNQYRTDTKKRKYLVNYFGLQDLRFEYFLDSLALYNELMPFQPVSRQEFISFFNGLENIKNYIFNFKNPDYRDSINTVSIDNNKMTKNTVVDYKYRFQIPFSNVKLRADINENIEELLKIRNKLWEIIYPSKQRNTTMYSLGQFYTHPIYESFSQIMADNYDRELQIRRVADVCWNCGDMFKYKKGKKFCSMASEEKDCGKQYRNNRDYFKHRKKRKLRSKKYMSEYRKLLRKHGISNK
jgi:hypothetical protein